MFICLGGCSSLDVSDNGPPYECEIEEAKAETKEAVGSWGTTVMCWSLECCVGFVKFGDDTRVNKDKSTSAQRKQLPQC